MHGLPARSSRQPCGTKTPKRMEFEQDADRAAARALPR